MVRPVHLSASPIQCDAQWVSQSLGIGDEVFDLGAIEVGTLNLNRGVTVACPASVRPVHLSASHIQCNPNWISQSCGDEVFDIGAIEVGTTNLSRPRVPPVHLSASHIQRDAP